MSSNPMPHSLNSQKPLYIGSWSIASPMEYGNIPDLDIDLKEGVFRCVKSYDELTTQIVRLKEKYNIDKFNGYSILVDKEDKMSIVSNNSERTSQVERNIKLKPSVFTKHACPALCNVSKVNLSYEDCDTTTNKKRRAKCACIGSSESLVSKKFKLSVPEHVSSSSKEPPSQHFILRESNSFNPKGTQERLIESFKLSARETFSPYQERASVSSMMSRAYKPHLLEYQKRSSTDLVKYFNV